jgi:hypothetical protein
MTAQIGQIPLNTLLGIRHVVLDDLAGEARNRHDLVFLETVARILRGERVRYAHEASADARPDGAEDGSWRDHFDG